MKNKLFAKYWIDMYTKGNAAQTDFCSTEHAHIVTSKQMLSHELANFSQQFQVGAASGPTIQFKLDMGNSFHKNSRLKSMSRFQFVVIPNTSSTNDHSAVEESSLTMNGSLGASCPAGLSCAA